MCGILGLYGSNSLQFVNSNIGQLDRRGPDSRKVIQVTENLTLGATRLSMTDPHPRSNQPMYDSDTGNFLVFNGEIYNYLEIKKQLSAEGANFQTYSDTEVLLKALIMKGNNFVEFLQGMFSFALYSNHKNQIILARDFLGKKPLYYSITKDYFIFSSQIKIIRDYIGQTSIDQNSLVSYLKLGYLLDPGTMYTEIKSVNPGEVLVVDLNSLNLTLEFNFIPRPILLPANTNFSDAFGDSFKNRVEGHSKIAISLSGGIDSTAIALQSVRTGVNCSTYSMWWPESDKSRYNQDFIAAKSIANSLNLKFIPVEMPSLKNLNDQISNYVKAMGEPNSNPSGVSMMSLYESISSDGIRLVLTGDGADEIFGGYDRYKLIRKFNSFPNMNLTFLENILKKSGVHLNPIKNLVTLLQNSEREQFWMSWHELINNKHLRKLSQNLSLDKIGIENFLSFKDLYGKNSRIGNMMVRDLNIWLTMESNRKLDRISMWHSVEARSPFQSELVIGLAYRHMMDTKFMLLNKNIIRENYPELKNLSINKNKLGFISPLGHWLRNSTDLIQDSLMYIAQKFDFDKNELIKLSHSPQKGDYSNFRFLWSLIILAKWHYYEK